MNTLLHYFGDKITVSEDLANNLKQLAIEKEFEKGTIIQKNNSFKKEHIFVSEGCLRSFFVDKNGKEHTVQFAVKNWWISDYTTLYTNESSVLTIESVSKSKVLIIDALKMEQLFNEFSELERFQRKNFERHLASLQKRVLNLLSLSALEKYEKFIKNYADFLSYIPNYQIASYLGITPESLSRIRKERVKNKIE